MLVVPVLATVFATCPCGFADSVQKDRTTEEDSSQSNVPANEYDVIVYGSTSGAIMAAVQVRQMGRSVALVSPDSHLGGMTISGLGATDCYDARAVGGLARDFYHRVWQHYQKQESWTREPFPQNNFVSFTWGAGLHPIDDTNEVMWVFEPHIAESIMEQLIEENHVPVFRDERLDRSNGVTVQNKIIQSMKTVSGLTFRGKVYIDATYEGDLMAAAGVSYTAGREANSLYDETINGVQKNRADSHQFTGFIDPYTIKGDKTSGILPGIQPEIKESDGQADDKIQAYCFRLCLTNDPANRVPFAKPDNYNEQDYELLFRSIEAGQQNFTDFSKMPNRKTDSNNWMGVSTDFIGQNYGWPEGSYQERQAIYDAHVQWQKGLFWTLANHTRVPEEIRQKFQSWGLARDEFIDHDNWPYFLYVREARRMVSDFVMTEKHLQKVIACDQSIGLGTYTMDSHHVQRYIDTQEYGKPSVRNEGDVQIFPGGPYRIDYRAITPRKGECGNLLVPVCLSSSHIAFGSIRMEPVFMILGQSAATAAVLSLQNHCNVQDLDYMLLKEQLLQDGQVLLP
ncbi:MAG: FAD-dependent oxidoreductase [Planctomycetia bacterium]|nr:FAD-dependent oxidoreductase [Planctomycetia bacterium]